MTDLEFIASLAESFAWPIAALLIALVFRKPISTILGAIRKMRYGDLEFDLQRELDGIKRSASSARVGRESIEGALHMLRDVSSQYETIEDEVKAVATVSPLAAIPLAWSYVEREIREAVSRIYESAENAPAHSVMRNIQILRSDDHLDEDAVEVLHRMRQLRNDATHRRIPDEEVTLDDALEFLHLTSEMVLRLRLLGREDAP